MRLPPKKLLRMCTKNYFLSFCIIFIGFQLQAQDTLAKQQNPIEDEFQELIENSNNYQGYKVVDYDKLIRLRNNTKSHIGVLKNEITVQKNRVDQQNEEIQNLKNELGTTQNNLNKVTEEKDALTFLGMPFTKGGYKAMMWAIVAILLLILIVVLIRYKRSHSATREAQLKLQETESEFDIYRKKALEKEQRLGRQLQDERNKSSNN